MPERDFDKDFGEIMIGQAAEDPDLTDHFKSKIYDPVQDGEYPGETGFIQGLVRWQYPMDQSQMNRAVGRCIANLIDGVKLGEDAFK